MDNRVYLTPQHEMYLPDRRRLNIKIAADKATRLNEVIEGVKGKRHGKAEAVRKLQKEFKTRVLLATTPIRRLYGVGLLSEKDFARPRAERRRIVALIRRGERRLEKVSYRRAWKQLHQTFKTT